MKPEGSGDSSLGGWDRNLVHLTCRACGVQATFGVERAGQTVLDRGVVHWFFTSDTGWLCPEHAPTNGSSSPQETA